MSSIIDDAGARDIRSLEHVGEIAGLRSGYSDRVEFFHELFNNQTLRQFYMNFVRTVLPKRKQFSLLLRE